MNLKTTESVKESLSALMDAEGDELDLRRVLKGLDESPEAADTWRRYHLARSVMHRERESSFTMDISAAVSAEVEMISRDAQVAEPVAERRSLFSFAGSAAIAAGVAVMVITGVQVFNGTDTGVPSLNGSGAELASGASGLQGGAVHQVSQPSVNAEASQWAQPSAAGGLMQVGVTASPSRPMFMAPQNGGYDSGMSSSNVAAADLAQRRLLEAYLSKSSERGPVPERSEWISLQDVAQ
ncbi:sigma-E factor negative regulatory protein [Cobetia sp. 14N.309.X.WAT.E.A4]|uniref:sigma-E factor negative regulatory protein n=1 Tax=Cobetia sp. 14N.309.X.WAT.E.A4 TaxID=2998323 RepID=UPI0025AF17F4|nr:sigma-E factor negative regulatory protein [Cobetia sp. 14N.309.X.WAT.E.A4]MDN2655098.1 sigma-E factor negative regulatory protein [Cobetia sp. 14N.309.X.WAT.E.A4]